MKKYYVIAIALLLTQACSEKFLDVKPEKSLVVPSTLEDYLAILDNHRNMNTDVIPYYGEISSDDFFLSEHDWETIVRESEKYAYIWASDFYGGMPNDMVWNRAYQTVFYANIALEGAMKHPESKLKNTVVGSALFYRAWVHYWMLNLYAKQYDVNTAKEDRGIPLRLEADINAPSILFTVQESYDQIIGDLTEAVELLPNRAVVQTRPSKLATYALLSRIMLQMGDYKKALMNADSALKIQSELMNYNDIDSKLDFPFQQFNQEVIFHAYFYAQPFNIARYQIEPELYNSFLDSDLRKDLFFFENNDHITYRGSYNGSHHLFCGLGIDELYLVKAECLVRSGEWKSGLEVLNKFLKTRFESVFFEPLIADNNDTALFEILRERRKQLMFRGIRWLDLKRLNKETQLETILSRTVRGNVYNLEPNSARYIYPFPTDVKKLAGF